jgi:hypothetical protein
MRDDNGAGGYASPGPAPLISRHQRTDPGQVIAATRRATIPARSIAYPPPNAGRSQWMHVVPRCPFGCRTAHVHRAGPEGGRRRAGCGRGSYVVEPWAVREVSE